MTLVVVAAMAHIYPAHEGDVPSGVAPPDQDQLLVVRAESSDAVIE